MTSMVRLAPRESANNCQIGILDGQLDGFMGLLARFGVYRHHGKISSHKSTFQALNKRHPPMCIRGRFRCRDQILYRHGDRTAPTTHNRYIGLQRLIANDRNRDKIRYASPPPLNKTTTIWFVAIAFSVHLRRCFRKTHISSQGILPDLHVNH